MRKKLILLILQNVTIGKKLSKIFKAFNTKMEFNDCSSFYCQLLALNIFQRRMEEMYKRYEHSIRCLTFLSEMNSFKPKLHNFKLYVFF